MEPSTGTVLTNSYTEINNMTCTSTRISSQVREKKKARYINMNIKYLWCNVPKTPAIVYLIFCCCSASTCFHRPSACALMAPKLLLLSLKTLEALKSDAKLRPVCRTVLNRASTTGVDAVLFVPPGAGGAAPLDGEAIV